MKNNNNPLLFGNDPEPNIVAVEHTGDAVWKVYSRNKGKLTEKNDAQSLFFYTNKNEPLLKKLWDDCDAYELNGNLHLNVLVETDNPKFPFWFKNNVSQLNNFYMPRLRSQYFITTGKTLFKDMDYDGPLRAYFDLEVLTTKGYKFPQPTRSKDKICMIPYYMPNGNSSLFLLNDDIYPLDLDELEDFAEQHKLNVVMCKTERDLLKSFIKNIQQTDPDILINHNIFNFDLKYLSKRCDYLNIEFTIGRSKRTPRIYPVNVFIGDKTREILCFDVYGRHVLDTELMARQADSVAREYPNYTLKGLIAHLGMERKDRTHIPPHEITQTWFQNRMQLIKYSMDDVYDARQLDVTFGQGIFESTKFTPMTHQDVSRLATGGKSQSLFVRYYHDHDHSLPIPDKSRKYKGGYAGVGKYGLHTKQPIIGIDIRSLYPSIAINQKIHPYKDTLKYYQQIINIFKQYRININDQIEKVKNNAEKNRLVAFDSSIKPYLNTISYGYIASQNGLFNDYNEAERITKTGQKILKWIIKKIEDDGGQVYKQDTDGLICYLPHDPEPYVDKLNTGLPNGITLKIDDRYKSVFVVDGKSYATINQNDKPVIKGDTLKSRGKERFILDCLSEMLTVILAKQPKKIKGIYDKWLYKIENKLLTAHDVAQSEELKISLKEYEAAVRAGSGKGGRNRSAGYELALKQTDMEYTIGDKIIYYVTEYPVRSSVNLKTGKVTERVKKLPKYYLAKPIEQFDPDNINIPHYVERLKSSVKPIVRVCYTMENITNKFKIKFTAAERRKYNTEIAPKLTNKLI